MVHPRVDGNRRLGRVILLDGHVPFVSARARYLGITYLFARPRGPVIFHIRFDRLLQDNQPFEGGTSPHDSTLTTPTVSLLAHDAASDEAHRLSLLGTMVRDGISPERNWNSSTNRCQRNCNRHCDLRADCHWNWLEFVERTDGTHCERWEWWLQVRSGGAYRRLGGRHSDLVRSQLLCCCLSANTPSASSFLQITRWPGQSSAGTLAWLLYKTSREPETYILRVIQ